MADSAAASDAPEKRRRLDDGATPAPAPTLEDAPPARAFNPAWLRRSNVDRRSHDALSPADFIAQYESCDAGRGAPLIVTHVVPRWRGATEWTRERLVARFGAREFRVSAALDMELAAYFEYCDAQEAADSDGARRDERPLYLFDKDWLLKCPEMAGEFEVPKYFREDLMGVLGGAGAGRRWWWWWWLCWCRCWWWWRWWCCCWWLWC